MVILSFIAFAALTGLGVYLTERIDRPLRRAARLAEAGDTH